MASCALLLTPYGWAATIGLLTELLLFGRTLDRVPTAVSGTAVVVMCTVATHAVFFGTGRYALVVFPLVVTLVGVSKQSLTNASMPMAL